MSDRKKSPVSAFLTHVQCAMCGSDFPVAIPGSGDLNAMFEVEAVSHKDPNATKDSTRGQIEVEVICPNCARKTVIIFIVNWKPPQGEGEGIEG